MAARVWRTVLGLQLALALGIAVTIASFTPMGSPWLTVAMAVAAFIVLQYLFGFFTIAASRGSTSWRAALGEPVCFALVEFAMALGSRPRDLRGSPGSPARGPLLLVHGFACNAGAWRWLLPRLFAAGFRPIRAVNLEPVTADIEVLARQLGRDIAEFHRAQGGAAITLVAHSMGGLVCRATLRDLDPRMVRRLVTIGTPHHGAAIARLLSCAPVRQMRTDSTWLAALNTARQAPVPIVSFYSQHDNFIAPAGSSGLPGAEDHALSGLGHFGLLVSRRAADCVLHTLREAA